MIFKEIVKKLQKMTFKEIVGENCGSVPWDVQKLLIYLKSVRERSDFHPEESAYAHTEIVTDRLIQTGKPDLIVSGIFHDLFKAWGNINPKNGYHTSPDHDKLAANFIRAAVKYNDYNGVVAFIEGMCANVERVAAICENHMKIKRIGEMRPFKQKKMRELDVYEDLLIFARADNMLVEFIV